MDAKDKEIIALLDLLNELLERVRVLEEITKHLRPA